ncbi:MAG: hypothetical protein HY000_22165 [Planctomycetes bacterium]|nr:hypothetical protein [Planctomycetota bacterium]
MLAHSHLLAVWRVLLVIVAILAAIWIWVMPGGFPVDHLRFWANRAAPVALMLVAGLGWFALWKGQAQLYLPIVLAVPVGWTSGAISALRLYPLSGRRFVWPAIAVAAVAWLLFWLTSRKQSRSWAKLALAAIAATLCGGGFPYTQRADEPSTKPVNLPLPRLDSGQDLRDVPSMLPLGPDLQFNPYAADARVNCDDLIIDVQPLLTFESRSPDRCWTIFAPLRDRVGPQRKLTAVEVLSDAVRAAYRDDGLHTLEIRAPNDDTTEIEAWTELRQPVFSHLNSFCTLTVRGHQ